MNKILYLNILDDIIEAYKISLPFSSFKSGNFGFFDWSEGIFPDALKAEYLSNFILTLKYEWKYFRNFFVL